MKPIRNAMFQMAATSVLAIVFSQSLQGDDGTWNKNANGNWSLNTNWLSNAIADGSGSTANFTFNITANRTVTLDSSRTITAVKFQDLTTASHDWTLAASNNSVLTLAGFQPSINAVHRTATISAPIAGNTAWSKTGIGALVLSAANTFDAGVTIANGTLRLNNSAAAGTGSISLVPGGTAGTATRLLINGGVTIANPVTIEGNIAGKAGEGPFQQTGTGQARVNGAITINGNPAAGGTFVGGGAVGNELVLGGAITTTIPNLSQRDGRVVYAGGGSGGSWTNLGVTHTALVGATDGIPTGVYVTLGGSAGATLDLNGFDQTLAGLTLGNAGESFVATVNLGAKTLTLNGNITCQTPITRTATHAINATDGSGTLNIGDTNRTLTLSDSLALDDLLITGASISGAGGITKEGAGTLALADVTIAGPLTFNGGTLATGGYAVPTAVSATIASLAFADATTLRMKAGPAGDLITTGTLTTAGTTTVKLSQPGGMIPNGTYPLIAYTGATPGLTGFSLSPFGHAAASLVDTGTAIALEVTGNDSLVWDGTTTNDWDGTNGNWKLSSTTAATDYIESDVVIFNDSPVSSDVVIGSNVSPSTVAFNNTTLTNYTLSGTGGIIGTTGLTKTADGSLTINTPNAYTGTTQIDAGSVVANFTAGTAIPSASAISIALNSSLTLGHNGGTIALNNPTLTGAGTVIIDPSLTTAGNRDLATVTWDASAFTGPLNLAPTTGTMRVQVNSTADIGTGPITIATGGQAYFNASNLTIPNDFTITGTGYSETAGVLGAIRASNPNTFTGVITVSGTAKIGAYGGNAIITNTLTGGDLTFGGSKTSTSSETLSITGDASGLTSLTVNDGLATAGGASIVVNIGNGGTTGTIGTVPVTLMADGFKNAILRYDRADGHTLVNSITSAPTTAANEVRNYLDLDCTGTGFDDNGTTIALGSPAPASGGTVRVGPTRANALATLTGTLTGERLWISSGQNNATLNLGSTADLHFNAFNLSESAGNSATVNHSTGAKVEVVGQLRVSHYGTNTSVYNMTGGTLTLSGDSPNLSPSTAGAGGNNATGDNNINALPTQQIVGGGIYLGNDGTGVFNHTDGTVSTNWIVLDNRGNTGVGTNMADGIDRYNLSGTGLLQLKSDWGMIARNVTTQVTLGGGTIQVDNTGTGTGTGPDITIPLDIPIDTVASTTTTLDTNAAVNTLNAFTLPRSVTGTGTLALTGGGTVNLMSTAGIQSISADLSSSGTPAHLNKLGSGTTMLTGSMAGFTGNVTVTEGRLDVPASLNTSVTVEALGTLSGEVALTTLALNGGTLLFDPTTDGTITAGTLTLSGDSLLDVSAAPGVGSFTALTYNQKFGTGTLAVANASNYRTQPVVTDNGSSTVSVTFAAGKSLNWTGTTSSEWKIAGDPLTESNWTADALDEVFYSGDSAIFPTGPTATFISLTGLLAPAGVSVTSDDTTNYTFISTPGNLLTGTTGITKSGTSTLTLVGANAYSGVTTINGGTIAIAADSLGSGVAGNSIALSGGGKLSHTGVGTADLGISRNIAVGTGGGILEHNNAGNATIIIPGALSGNEALTFQTADAGNATVTLSGDNAAYTGAISIGSLLTGTTTLSLATPAAVPAASSITVTHPAAATAGGANNVLNLQAGTTLGAGTTINMTSFLTEGNVSQRSAITSSGPVTINGPIKLSGNNIMQFNAGAASTMTFNGDFMEASPGSFVESTTPASPYSNVVFLRGVGTIVVNGKILLPSTGSTVAVTDGPTVIINSTDNDFRSASVVYGTLRLGSATAIPSSARLVIGQAANQNCTLDLNGFDQTVTDLVWSAATAATTRGISNSHLTATSTFTINQVAAPAGNFSGTFTGAINLVKKGSATTTLSTALSTFTGNVTVEEGQLTCAAGHNDTNANSALGVTNADTRSVTVKSGGTLAFTGNDNLGNAASSPILPIIVEAGGTLTNAGFNTMGPITLNGGTMTGTAGANANFQAYRLFGTVTAGGAAASAMTASGTNTGYHLHSTTTFAVADATLDAAADLIVSAPLINQSGTQGGGAGNLVKDGPGTMTLSGINTYTGDTVVNAGTLELANDAQLRFNIGATSGINNSLTGSGTAVLDGDFAIDTTAADALTAGTWVLENIPSLTGAYGANFQVVNPDGSVWASSGDKWTKSGAPGTIWTFDEATGTLTLSAAAGYDTWASQIPDAGMRARGDDPDGDGFTNGEEFLFGTSPIVADGALIATETSGGNLILRWLQRESGAAYLLMESTSLDAGSWLESTVVSELDDQTGAPTDYDRFMANIPVAGGMKFFRIEGLEN